MSSHAEHGHGDHAAHASVKFYWMIGGILAALTALEVAAYYMELGAVEVPILLVLSAAKFVLVVGFFMHLKFDSKVFTGVFVLGPHRPVPGPSGAGDGGGGRDVTRRRLRPLAR